MTQPRPVYAGETTMAQKQCHGQQFRLRPDCAVRQIILYVLGYCAEKYDMVLHEFLVMSNHDHIVATDPERNRPKFIGLYHSLVTRAVNTVFGDTDSLWSSRRHSAPRLLEGDDVFRRCVYTLLNPVKVLLVRYAWDWEGVTSWGLEYDVPTTIKRPKWLFSKDMPEEVTLVLRRPKAVRPELDDRELRQKIRAEVKRQQGDIAAEARQAGKSFVGMRRVLRQPRTNTPYTRDIRKGIRPNIASRSKAARIEALQDLQRFLADHAAAVKAEQAGVDATYPYGSYRAKLLGRRCAQAP